MTFERRLRNPPAQALAIPVDSQGALTKRAAKEVLQVMHKGNIRDAATARCSYGRSCSQPLSRRMLAEASTGSELAAAPSEAAPAVAIPEPTAEPHHSTTSPEIPPVRRTSKERWIVQQAAALVQAEECSYRIAVVLVRATCNLEVTVFACVLSSDDDMKPRRRPHFLPVEFTDKIVH